MPINKKAIKANAYTPQDSIYLTGSHTHVTRTVYLYHGNYFIQWYGDMIEVEHSPFGVGWRTILDY